MILKKNKLFILGCCFSLISAFCCACNEDNSNNDVKPDDTEQPGTEQPGTEQPGTEQPGTEQPGTEQPVETNPCPECEFGCNESKQCYTCDKGLFVCSDDNTAVLKCTKGQYNEFKKCQAENPCDDNTCGDFNENHLKDEYEPEKATDCVKNSDCTTGFCDRVIMKCSIKCTDNEQCMDGNLCRSDGYCAPKAFVTEWIYNQGIETTIHIPTAYADECNFTIDWGDDSEPESYTSCPNPNITHQYKHVYDEDGNLVADGNIMITITGTYKGWRLCPKDGSTCATNSSLLTAIHSFGPVGLGEYAFRSLRPIDISTVDIPNADLLTSMNHMFYEVKFTYGKDENERLMKLGLLSNWDVSNVTDMSYAFAKIRSTRNLDLSKWETSSVKDMSYMFYYQETPEFGISNWDVSNVTNMEGMFQQSGVNEPIGTWDVSNVTNMSHTFDQAYDFNQDISNWKLSNVTDMSYMLANMWEFNQDISRWDVSSVTNMEGMFEYFKYSPAIGAWNVSNVTNMKNLFHGCDECDVNLVMWDVSNVTDMSGMFKDARKFNQMLDGWNVSKVTDMSEMFNGALKFDQTLRHWDVSKVENMSRMFMDAESFNGEIGEWDVSRVTDFTEMFYRAGAFNQDLSNWHLDSLADCEKIKNMFYSTKIYSSSLKCPELETLLHESWGKTSCSVNDLHPSCGMN